MALVAIDDGAGRDDARARRRRPLHGNFDGKAREFAIVVADARQEGASGGC
jgi:hypothetical protein